MPAVRRAAPAFLFVYGTLMRGYPLHPVLAGGATFVGPGRARGRLVDLGAYPGLVAGAGTVRGEVYRIERPEVLPVLDREEGYNFERRRTLVTRERGQRTRAWVYRYVGDGTRAAPIPAGDWREARPPVARGRSTPPLNVARRRHS